MDKEVLRIISVKSGLSLNYISKEDKISMLLLQLSDILPDNFILKGGTALNRIYLQENGVQRFSEDMDIDMISRESINSRINKIKDLMKQVKDFDVGKGRLMHRTLRFNCGYINEIGHKNVVKLEFYMSHEKIIAIKKPENSLITSSYMSSTPALFNTYSLEDILARKLIALYNRTEGKDIYDVFYGLDTGYDRETLLDAINLLSGFYKISHSPEELFTEIKKKLDKTLTKSSYIGNSTNHYIPQKLRPNWFIFIKSLIEKIDKHKLQIQ